MLNCRPTLTSIVKEKFTFKTSPIEMAENLEWKNLKPIFLKAPVLYRNERVYHRLNSIETANSIAKANNKDKKLKSDEVLHIITQKLVKNINKAEKSINPHDGQQHQQQQQAVEVNCERLKSIFMEHDVSTSTDTKSTDVRVKSEQGFISSHLKASANTDSTDDCVPTNNQSGNKPLISEDMINNWISSSPSAPTPRENPLDGIFPQTPSLSRSSKKINKKVQLNTSRFFD